MYRDRLTGKPVFLSREISSIERTILTIPRNRFDMRNVAMEASTIYGYVRAYRLGGCRTDISRYLPHYVTLGVYGSEDYREISFFRAFSDFIFSWLAINKPYLPMRVAPIF